MQLGRVLITCVLGLDLLLPRGKYYDRSKSVVVWAAAVAVCDLVIPLGINAALDRNDEPYLMFESLITG